MKESKTTLYPGDRSRVSLLLTLALAVFSACSDDETATLAGQMQPLQVEVTTGSGSRTPVFAPALPDDSPIGVTLTASDGSAYDGQTAGYTNIPYTASTADELQTWQAQDAPVYLSTTQGTACAYWPYNPDAGDMTAVPVETDTQTDYMYSGPFTGLSGAQPKASFTMKHAMALIRVNVVKGTYTAAGNITAATVASQAFCTSGTMNAFTGALAGLGGAGTTITQELQDVVITSEGISVEFLVLPDSSLGNADVTVGVNIDDKTYTSVVQAAQAFQPGYAYTYKLTLNNTGLYVSSAGVSPWQLQSTVDKDLELDED